MCMYEGNHPFKGKVKKPWGGNSSGLFEEHEGDKFREWGRVGGNESRVLRQGQITSVLIDYCEDLGSESESDGDIAG